MKKLNCWEFMRCGRELGGAAVDELGECLAATNEVCDGVNGGSKGGRICWVVAGTLCGGDIQSTYAHKATTCFQCPFYKVVYQEEGAGFEQGSRVLPKIYDPLQMAQAYEQLSYLALSMSFSEEHKRHVIANELHDRISQNLAVAKLRIDKLAAAAPDLDAELEQVAELISEVMNETRNLTYEISSPLLYALGLVPAIEWMLDRVELESTLHVVRSELGPLDLDLQVLIFQAIRELTTNVIKHASAAVVRITLERTNTLIVASVEDDGVGFSYEAPTELAERGFGLLSLRNRLGLLGGKLEVQSRSPGGSRVIASLPLNISPSKRLLDRSA